MSPIKSSHETDVSMASSAGLEVFWSAIAVCTALLGIVGSSTLTMAAVACIALAFAVLAQTGTLAAGWPREAAQVSEERDAISVNVLVGLGSLALGALALAGIATIYLAPIGLLMLAGLLVLDAPLEPALAAPRGYLAGAYMVISGLGSILLLATGFSTRGGEVALVPWAALVISSAYLVAASAVLVRHARGARA
jgi:hypothetical protein